MQAVTVPRMVAALALTVAAVLAVRGFGPRVELSAPPVAEPAPAEAALGTRELDGAEATETPAAAKLRELNTMSETFRNSTFLIAIRDEGFVCRELLDVYGGVNNSMTWTASCSEMLAYTVSVATTGTLEVEPLLQHLDAVPRPVQRAPEPERLPLQRR